MTLFRQIYAATLMNLKGVPQRLGASLVTVVGVATTVAVMISLLAIGAGLMQTGGRNVKPENVIVLPAGAQSEFTGSFTREAVGIIAQAPGVKKFPDGEPMAQPAAMVIVEVEQKSDGTTTNIPIRGMTLRGISMDRTLKLTEGRMFRPAVHELIVGKHPRRRFKNLDVGDRVSLRGSEWTVVGAYDANGGMADNALLADADTVMAAFERTGYQSVDVVLESPDAFSRFKDGLTADPRLDVEPKRLKTYVNEQMKQLTTVLNFVGYFVGGVMAIGAVIGALNTMYSAVDARVREIATLRALGFSGAAVVVSVLAESLALALPGALLGAALAWLLFNGRDISTVGLTFPLAVTPGLVWAGIVLSLVIGLIGGFAPSIRAARLPVATALRAV